MIRYLIKNNFKLMTRSITNCLIIVIAPLVLIALLSSSFDDTMKRYENDSDIAAGYRIEGENVSDDMINEFVKGAKDNGYILSEYPTGNPEEIMKEKEIGGFVIFKDDTYTILQNNAYKEEGKALEYAVNSFYENVIAAASGIKTDSVKLDIEHPDYMEPIDSTDYYGIIEIVYFGWCAIVCGAGIFMSEKKYRINKKFRVSALSETELYLGKFVPILSSVVLGNAITILLSKALFGVHWGNPFYSALIVLFSVAAATALGLMAYNIFDNIVVTIIAVFIVVWLAGFFGGSFETYMFSSHPMSIKQLSPIYYINRSLVELSCMGHSDYVGSALIYSGAITIICSAVAILAGTIRRRGRA